MDPKITSRGEEVHSMAQGPGGVRVHRSPGIRFGPSDSSSPAGRYLIGAVETLTKQQVPAHQKAFNRLMNPRHCSNVIRFLKELSQMKRKMDPNHIFMYILYYYILHSGVEKNILETKITVKLLATLPSPSLQAPNSQPPSHP